MPGAPIMRPVAELLRSCDPQEVAEALRVPSGVLRSAIATGRIDGLLWGRLQAHLTNPHPWTCEPWEYLEDAGDLACPARGSVHLDVCHRNHTEAAARFGNPEGCGACALGTARRAARAGEGEEILRALRQTNAPTTD